MQYTLFISDIHLCPEQPGITQLFLDFLQGPAKQADAVYILGDLFEVWIGDDDDNAFNLRIQKALKQLTGHVPVYLMVGNRDFLLGKTFCRRTGCHWLPDPSVINLYGQPLLLMHGDSLCTEDKQHQRFRLLSRSKLLQGIFVCLPLRLRRRIANTIRQRSQQRQQQLSLSIMDVVPAAVAKTMTHYQVKQLIHGHTHRPGFHDLTLQQQSAKRIVLGAWHNAGNMLQYNADGSAELVTLPPT